MDRFESSLSGCLAGMKSTLSQAARKLYESRLKGGSISTKFDTIVSQCAARLTGQMTSYLNQELRHLQDGDRTGPYSLSKTDKESSTLGENLGTQSYSAPPEHFSSLTYTRDGGIVVGNANDKQVGGDHYKSTVQHWDYVVANEIPYLEAQVIRYLTRWRKKGGHEDVRKANHFLQKLMETEGILTETGPARVPRHDAGQQDGPSYEKVSPEPVRQAPQSGNVYVAKDPQAWPHAFRLTAE